ncbi:2160_t:CDS:2 [Funneliformis geosporum]|nr:2160_t:CDS:2 [Funneliformis geosporum]
MKNIINSSIISLDPGGKTGIYYQNGAIECLAVAQVKKVNVLEVKKLTKQLLAGVKKLKEIEYQQGRGKG